MKITFPLLLTLLFIGLKLSGNIDWSWWWVLLPAYLPIVALPLFLVFAAIAAGLVGRKAK